jgi:hypothetical protein
VRVWVLSTCIPSEDKPCWPEVFFDEETARKRYDEAIREEWAANTPEDGNTCEPLPYPDDPDAAHAELEDWHGPGWGHWELSVHEVPLKLSLKDLVFVPKASS